MNMVDHAINYAQKMMWAVFPCGTNKQPIIPKERGGNGCNDATTDIEQIKKWWKEYPDASIGLACGPKSGVWVLDIDLPKGPESLDTLQFNNGQLPQTLTQKTGGGGQQYIWKWNGHNIRNSTSKVSENIDVRGEGGYIILPPSSHPSGNSYEWLTKAVPTEAPEWLALLAERPKVESPDVSLSSSGNTRYGQKALDGELVKIYRSESGTRNDTLNTAAYSLGQLIAGKELEYDSTVSELLNAALRVGLKENESRATVSSGITKGMLTPRSNPNKEEGYDLEVPNPVSIVSNVSSSSNAIKPDQIVSGLYQNDDSLYQSVSPFKDQKQFNLHALIGEWIKNSSGYFTVDQLDREFCLKTRAEKLGRSRSLQVYKEKDIIKKDKTIKGKWFVIDSSIDWVDLEKADDTPFNIVLPFDLHERVVIPTKSIIVLAGSSNAGKTTFAMNTLKLNFDQDYPKVYLMSEMGSGQYKRRVLGFGDSLALWNSKIRAAERSFDFESAIQNHNPNGLTCIDFLEEVDGEYFKIPTSIRNIYDALGTGCALIAIQKKNQSQYGKGGEATREKACLYIILDLLCVLESEDERSIFCSLKLDKVKESVTGNMEGKELHFRIDRGAKMTMVMDWTYSSKVNRTKCIQEYMVPGASVSKTEFTFITKEGGLVTLFRRDYEAWKNAYHNFDLDAELNRVSDQCNRKSWLRKGHWTWQLGQHLDEKEREFA